MANVTVSDGGRQIIVAFVSSGGVALPVSVGPPCNFKVIDGWWQDTVASTDTLAFNDAKGRAFTFKASTDLVPIAIGKFDLVEGPITITQMSSGTLYFILGNK